MYKIVSYRDTNSLWKIKNVIIMEENLMLYCFYNTQALFFHKEEQEIMLLVY